MAHTRLVLNENFLESFNALDFQRFVLYLSQLPVNAVVLGKNKDGKYLLQLILETTKPESCAFTGLYLAYLTQHAPHHLLHRYVYGNSLHLIAAADNEANFHLYIQAIKNAFPTRWGSILSRQIKETDISYKRPHHYIKDEETQLALQLKQLRQDPGSHFKEISFEAKLVELRAEISQGIDKVIERDHLVEGITKHAFNTRFTFYLDKSEYKHFPSGFFCQKPPTDLQLSEVKPENKFVKPTTSYKK